MSLRRQAIRLAYTLKGAERRALLDAIVASDKESGEVPEAFKKQWDKNKDDEKDDEKDEGEKKGGKKASRNLLAAFRGSDRMLAREVAKLASRLPQHRSVLLDTLKQAANEDGSVPNEGFDPTEIGEVEQGGGEELDSDETYMKDEFTQQEFHELGDLQEGGSLAKGQDDPQKYASNKTLRKSLIRLASTMPKGSKDRQAVLYLLSDDS